MELSNLRTDSSMGRLDAMQALVSNYQTTEDILLDLSRHALAISVNAKVAQFSSENLSDQLCKMACDFQCHYDKIARRLQIKNGRVAIIDVSCCDFSAENSIMPQLLNLITDMKDCLASGFSSVNNIGDKAVLSEISACLDEDIYCITKHLIDPA